MDPFASALEIAEAIRRKEISPTEVVRAYLARIDRLNPKLNAFIWRRDEELLAEAESATASVMRGENLGPFHGVPIPIKDLTDVAGWPTTYGSKGAKGHVSTHTAAVVDLFKQAGFLLMGRTNTPEFGTLPVTENEAHGATRNPWNPEHTPGGSSGGAAAAVAAGLAPLAHANDGGGSIRIPAACSGLVGLKPSRGRVPLGPPMACDVMHGGCVEGVVTRTVADTAAVLDAVSAFDPLAWYNAPRPKRRFLDEVGAPVGKLRVALSTETADGTAVAQSCIDAVEAAGRLLAELGHEVAEGGPDWKSLGADFTAAFITVWSTGSAYWEVEDWSQIERLNAALREQSQQTDSLAYLKALLGLQRLSRELVAHWGRDFDVLVTPTIATEPPTVGALFRDYDADPSSPLIHAAAMVPFTPAYNVSGQPAISLPLHWGESGLPVGVQIVGGPWDEALLLRLASQIEEAAPWRDRRPPLD